MSLFFLICFGYMERGGRGKQRDYVQPLQDSMSGFVQFVKITYGGSV